MTDRNDKLSQLLEKLEFLQRQQDDFSREIGILRTEIYRLKALESQQSVANKAEDLTTKPAIKTSSEPQIEEFVYERSTKIEELEVKQPAPDFIPKNKPQERKSDLEIFIGENLINKIGIAITVIGVAIGAKYSIENNLISPLTRIIMGYVFGLGMLGTGVKLKQKYASYSAVLVSGAMAILYFITFAAYGFYSLIPQTAAFILMVVFTVFTVLIALHYNKQVIAHIGLVGAYAVPFLLSDGSGNVSILFSYIAIINIGILGIAFKKYWKLLYYVSFGLTWIIFISWYLGSYQISEHFELALVFSTTFFAIFYSMFLSYKAIQKEQFILDDVFLLLLNSFIFYGLGYSILESHDTGSGLLGAFTLLNALLHFIVCVLIYLRKLADAILYLVAGLALVFLTLAVPVQLDGNWVTVLWVGESAVLYWIGKTKKISFYEKLSYPLMLLAFISLLQDWTYVYDSYELNVPSSRITPIFNVNFLTSTLFIAAFSFICFLSQSQKYRVSLEAHQGTSKSINDTIAAILIITIYCAFRLEISCYWNQMFTDSDIQQDGYSNFNMDLHWFKSVWIINYSLLFASILSFINQKKLKSRDLGLISFSLSVLVLFVFLIQGLYDFSELRESYLEQTLAKHYQHGLINLWLRYVSFLFVALTLLTVYRFTKQNSAQSFFKLGFDFLLHTTILWITSSELIHWLDIAKYEQSYKLGLSILWGVYALFLIVLGIWKKNKPLRIGAICLFGITLFKLFFYDISHLNTISKTIVFVTLGLLLLIISFLYNKYKLSIGNDEEVKN